MSPQSSRFYEFGRFRIDTAERVLTQEGEPLLLTPKVFDTLLLLVENSGHIVDKDKLMEELWPNTFVEEGNLTQNISVLRKLLGDGVGGQHYIQTVPRRGYRFTAPVKESFDPVADVVIEEHVRTRIIEQEVGPNGAISADSNESLRAASSLQVWKWSSERLVVSLGLVTLLVSVLVLSWWAVSHPSPSAARSALFSVANVTLRRLTNSGNVAGAALSPDGQFFVYGTSADGSRTALWLRRIDGKESLQLVGPKHATIWSFTVAHHNDWVYYVESDPNDLDLQGGGTIYRISVLGGETRKLTERVHSDVTLSPDDRLMAFDRFSATGCDLVVANTADGSGERIIASNHSTQKLLHPQWSPEGSRILFFDIDTRPDGLYWSLQEIAPDGSAIKEVLAPRKQKIWFMTWGSNGQGIVMNATDPATNLPQLYYVSYPDGATQRITNDFLYYNGVSVGGDSVVTALKERPVNIWLTNDLADRPARPVLSGTNFLNSVSWTPEGRLVYEKQDDDGKHHLWIMDADGNHQQLLSPPEAFEILPDVSPDGRYIVCLSKRSGALELWRMDMDGRNPKQLTTGNHGVWLPRFAPDGRSVFFEMDRDQKTVLAKIPITGGEPVDVVNDVSLLLYDPSPDGQQVAYSFADEAGGKVRVAVRSLAVARPPNYYDIAPGKFLRWMPDGLSLAFEQFEPDGSLISGIWLQPLAGGEAKQLINVHPDSIYWAEWSRDGKQLAFVRGRLISDLVLVSQRKEQ